MSFICNNLRGVTWRMTISLVSVILGSLQVGYHVGNDVFPESEINDYYSLMWRKRYDELIPPERLRALTTVFTSIPSIMGFIGVWLVPPLAAYIGRKKTLILNNIFIMIALFLMLAGISFKSIELLIINRVIIGFCCSIGNPLIALYIQEVAPEHCQGFFSVINQLSFLLGNYLGEEVDIRYIWIAEGWLIAAHILAIPVILHTLILCCCPASPYFLFVIQKKERQAVEVLQKLQGQNDIRNKVEELNNEVDSMERKPTLCKLFRNYSKSLLIAFIINASVEFSGFDAITSESLQMFQDSKIDHAKERNIGLWIVRGVSIITAVFLVDFIGMQNLLLVGQTFTGTFNILLAITQISMKHLPWMKHLLVFSIFSTVVSYQLGPGPLCESITGELFSHSFQPLAMAVASSFGCIIRLLVSIAYEYLKDIMGPSIFMTFGGVQLTMAFLIFFFIKNTKKEPDSEV